ncbi:MAG: hypothetical protein K2H00_06405 [Muribaculum intestinale]|nr:hypothetical protein [Muribaculum intestinale]
MGLFRALFYDGKKCYCCRRTDTEWVGSKRDLSAFPDSIKETIVDMAASIYQHCGRNFDVYYCNRCRHYFIDYPSTSDIRGTQSYFKWNGRRLK